jgi:hypothetical protein
MGKAKLIRLVQEEVQTLGQFLFFDAALNIIFKCKVLELPDRNNQKSISRILAGKYKCVLRYSVTYGWHYHVLDVKGRTLILVHFGNYYLDTEGCLIVGNNFTDINKDGYRDVTSSRKTLKKMLAIVGNEFELLIVDE